jgi:nicotinamide-nucleotide amidase
MKTMALNCDLLLVTGGLGPTADDRTREAFADSLNKKLDMNTEALASMSAWFAKRDAVMPPANDVQAMVPEGSSWIPNLHGTAPGLLGKIGDCIVLCLPGPPNELQPMFKSIRDNVFSSLELGMSLHTSEIHSWGMAESIAGEIIDDLMQSEDPSVSILMGIDGITARVTGSDGQEMKATVQEITQRWSPWVYGNDGASLAASVGALLVERSGTLVTAESCTGGCLSGLLVSVSGASDWFQGGWVTYSNELKVSQLGIDQTMIDEYGAVSTEVVSAMCHGAIERSGATCALSTSGIAGPTGGSKEKPIGSVYIGCCVDGQMRLRLFRFSGDRDAITIRAACTALQMLRLQLRNEHTPVLCWQHGVEIQC